MEWLQHSFQKYPELAIFLTLASGFFVGKIKIGKFSLGSVTGVLLMGVLVGQMHITISADIKSVFFLMFLFAVGYSVGPQFFQALKKDGIPQMVFSALVCVACLLTVWLLAILMHYSVGQAAGLMAGSQTISAVLGVASEVSPSFRSAMKRSSCSLTPCRYVMPSLISLVRQDRPGS